MSLRLSLLLAVGLLVAPEARATDSFDIGAGFYQRCVSFGGSVGQMTTCLTFLLGMHEGVRALAQHARVPICFDGEPRDTMEPFVRYLERSAARLGNRTADLYLLAMLEAYPCPRRPRT